MTTANVIPFQNAGSDGGPSSPFDQYKRVAPDGTEFWSARDLADPFGYRGANYWLTFRGAVERAMASAEAQNMQVSDHFLVNQEKTAGRTRENFMLTRFAAYLVAMNGDPRKPEIASAQAYFAIKTRQAEVVQHEIPQTYAAALKVAGEQAERAELAANAEIPHYKPGERREASAGNGCDQQLY